MAFDKIATSVASIDVLNGQRTLHNVTLMRDDDGNLIATVPVLSRDRLEWNSARLDEHGKLIPVASWNRQHVWIPLNSGPAANVDAALDALVRIFDTKYEQGILA